MFTKILIANRGEIACRIIRTARRMGLRTVAVYSDADADALHVTQADEAHRIGPAPARESYLAADAILDAARRSGAEAIHPGYGFLSENERFAEACATAGVVFIGPPPSAIRAMGGKARAKALMEKAGVPLVPGYHGADQDPALLRAEAERIGWPVLIKASAGGGGKGMKVAPSAAAFDAQLTSARRESAAAFGDDRVLIEKYLERPRHVEIQVFADNHGRCVSLFERDCSIQRRHQKVIEEAPAPNLPHETRRHMSDAAITAATAIGYAGAGTVEFLYDPAAGGFYFMEMNTRLQVEHPVTEMITGLDLVEWQFRVAAGEPLPVGWDELTIHGHAIEARLYAEDPDRDFLPQTGALEHLRFPPHSAHARVDAGVRAGDSVGVHYDPMIAKLIVWDVDRAAAVRRMRQTLAAIQVAGLTTNLRFLERVVSHPAFLAAELDTHFIDRHHADLLPEPTPASPRVLALAALGVLLDRERTVSADPWSRTDGWRLNEEARDSLIFKESEGQEHHAIGVVYHRDGYRLELPDGDSLMVGGAFQPDGALVADLGGVRLRAGWVRQSNAITVFHPDGSHRLTLVEPLADALEQDLPNNRVVSPMPGTIIARLVEPGARVEKGQPLLVREAMKMEHTLKAPGAGVLTAFRCAVGEPVSEGVELVTFAMDED